MDCVISPTSNYILHPNRKTVNPFTPLSFSKSEIPPKKWKLFEVTNHQNREDSSKQKCLKTKAKDHHPIMTNMNPLILGYQTDDLCNCKTGWTKKTPPLGCSQRSIPKIQTCIFGVLVDDVGSAIMLYLCEVKQHAHWDHVVGCHLCFYSETVSGNGNPKQPNKVNSIHGPSWDPPKRCLWCSPRDFVAMEPVDMDPVGRRRYGEAELMRYPQHIFENAYLCW